MPTLDPSMAVLADQAQWAETFPSSSLAGRRAEYQQRKAQADQADLQGRILTDQTAQNAYFKGQQLEMQRAKHDYEMEVQPQLDALKLRTEAQEAKSRAAMSAADLALKNATLKRQEAQAVDDTNFLTEMTEMADAADPDSPEYEQFFSQAVTKAPRVSPAILKQWAPEKYRDIPPEEVARQVKAARAVIGGNAVVMGNKSGVTITDRPESNAAEQRMLNQRLLRLESLRSKADIEPDQKAYFTEEIEAVKSQLSPQAASAPVASVSPATKRRKWNPGTSSFE